MDSLPEDATGRWRMRTANGSVYELDLDAWTAQRVPDLANAYAATLRRDGEVLPLVERPEIQVARRRRSRSPERGVHAAPDVCGGRARPR